MGFENKSTISDCGTLHLAPDEQITLVTESGKEYDVTRKEWGFYATPSMNWRLANFDLRAVLVKNRVDRFFVMLVERGKEAVFDRYVAGEPLTIVAWLDTTEALQSLARRLAGDG